MYNGIGLTTPRGSGTNGYVIRNLSTLRSHESSQDRASAWDAAPPKHREPDEGILEHERKRKVEVKCLELQLELEDKGVEETEIEEQVGALRAKLLENLAALAPAAKGLKASDTHGLALAKKAELSKMARAFGTRSDYMEGDAFDREKQEENKIKRQTEREEKERKREEDKARMIEQKAKWEAERRERDRLRRREEDNCGRKESKAIAGEGTLACLLRQCPNPGSQMGQETVVNHTGEAIGGVGAKAPRLGVGMHPGNVTVVWPIPHPPVHHRLHLVLVVVSILARQHLHVHVQGPIRPPHEVGTALPARLVVNIPRLLPPVETASDPSLPHTDRALVHLRPPGVQVDEDLRVPGTMTQKWTTGRVWKPNRDQSHHLPAVDVLDRPRQGHRCQ
ncbi:hypothetical protein BD779DRAFT_368194 [Infundibulicybe gibba]|nr:hypothetical protein BD779DRAFT_368194 [Infundibulicybe gibba]